MGLRNLLETYRHLENFARMKEDDKTREFLLGNGYIEPSVIGVYILGEGKINMLFNGFTEKGSRIRENYNRFRKILTYLEKLV